MIASNLSSLAMQCAAGGVAGAVLGYGYFRALWWNVELIDRGAKASAAALFAARFALLALALFLLARVGAPALLAAAAGLLAARRLALRRFGGAP